MQKRCIRMKEESFNRVPHGVTEIKDFAQPLLHWIFSNDARLESDGVPDKRQPVLILKRPRFDSRPHFCVPNEAVFDHFCEPGSKLRLRQGFEKVNADLNGHWFPEYTYVI